MPGFPEMAHPMIDDILAHFIPQAEEQFSRGFIAQCGEGTIQHLMIDLPSEIDLSSLPMMNNGKPKVEFRLSGTDKEMLEIHFKTFTDYLDDEGIGYDLL